MPEEPPANISGLSFRGVDIAMETDPDRAIELSPVADEVGGEYSIEHVHDNNTCAKHLQTI